MSIGIDTDTYRLDTDTYKHLHIDLERFLLAPLRYG